MHIQGSHIELCWEHFFGQRSFMAEVIQTKCIQIVVTDGNKDENDIINQNKEQIQTTNSFLYIATTFFHAFVFLLP